MTGEEPRIVRMPSDEEMRVKFEEYALAVGRVAHAWNMLHERLGNVFAAVLGARQQDTALAVWNSSDNDRGKQNMLRSAIESYHPNQWPHTLPGSQKDLLWLVDEAMKLGDNRNNAIHAPCVLVIDHDRTEMVASFFSQHTRAKKLRGKSVLVEFKWIEQWADLLSIFAQSAETAIGWPERYPWPDKPVRPERQPKTGQGQLPQP